jgi:hypothetical protein
MTFKHIQRVGLVTAVLVGIAVNLPMRAQAPVQDQQPAGLPLRPAVVGPSGGVSAGHPLTSAAAFATLLKDGNAFDAGVAALLVGGVVEQDLYSLGFASANAWYAAGASSNVNSRSMTGSIL